MTTDLFFRVLGDKWLRIVVLLLILAALAQQVALVVWRFVPAPEQTIPPPPPAAIVRGDDAGRDAMSFQQQANVIGRAFLFGKIEIEQKLPEPEEAPVTQLNYKLRGIYSSPDPRLSVAIIEVRPNDTKNYMIDDELADNITLARIERDYVLLDRYGKLERLNLEKPEPLEGSALAAQPAGTSAAAYSALLRSYKRRYTSNPMALATRFQAIPVQQDGKNIGFKLKPLRGETLLNKLNFEPDDIFTAVNGVSLQNPFEALDALKSLSTADRVTVTFLRNGAEQTLDFQI